ncbi:MAG: acyltransferase [Bacteroidia bacterium]
MAAATSNKKRGVFGKLKMKFLRWIAASFPHQAVRNAALRAMGFEVGEGVYIAAGLGLATSISDYSCHLKIGDRVSIGPGVMLVLASDPNNSRLRALYPPERGTITIEEDVWLGANVTILPNITIGKCSVIATGAVVTSDVPPFVVMGGIPAKKIKDLPADKLQH